MQQKMGTKKVLKPSDKGVEKVPARYGVWCTGQWTTDTIRPPHRLPVVVGLSGTYYLLVGVLKVLNLKPSILKPD